MRTSHFNDSFNSLPDIFYSPLSPTPVAHPRMIAINRTLADELDLQINESDLDIFAGNRVPDGANPIALAYAGHQFGNFVPQLGDGRAMLLGEIQDRTGRRRDIQLKGSGPTPFSRNGDGRAALGPVLREYLLSEAMHALGIPTTRALAAVATGEPVYRESILPGAILTRVAASHIRVGTFQYAAARGDSNAVRALADYVIARHHPLAAESENPCLALLDAVGEAQARLVARWMQVGFIHGVMNTDNFTVSGETIDYGPCAFMDGYAPETVFSAIDQSGRYAYANQPPIAQWNLARFAETLLPHIHTDQDTALSKATESLERFAETFRAHWLSGMRAKLGLVQEEVEDPDLIQALLDTMQKGDADFTNTFRGLCEVAGNQEVLTTPRNDFDDPGDFEEWSARWQRRLEREATAAKDRAAAMRKVNPAVIPRNHLVERALDMASVNDDFSEFEDLLAVLQHPFRSPDTDEYTLPPEEDERVLKTFCGT